MVLIVEDETISRKALQQLLRLYGVESRAAASAEEAMRMVSGNAPPSLALVDINLPGMDGVEFVRRLHDIYPSLACVYMTANDDAATERQDAGAAEPMLRKPVDVSSLLQMILRTPGIYRAPVV